MGTASEDAVRTHLDGWRRLKRGRPRAALWQADRTLRFTSAADRANGRPRASPRAAARRPDRLTGGAPGRRTRHGVGSCTEDPMMTTITDAQHQILDAAVRRPDHIAAPPTNLPPAPRAAVEGAAEGRAAGRRGGRRERDGPRLEAGRRGC